MNDVRVGIVGMGLIGGSLALALKEAGWRGEIVACDPAAALDRRFADRVSGSPAAVAAECDVVVLATPVCAAAALLGEIAPACSPGTVVTDVGSTKRAFVRAAREAFTPEACAFVAPAHPIAGCEKSGVGAARADLFRARQVVLTPLDNTAESALDAVTRLWERVGAAVTRMDAEAHDALFAATSHLPHVTAYALVGALLASDYREQAIEYAAGGLRDFTRVAESDPVMWRDVCLTNRDRLLEAISDFETELKHLRRLVDAGDGAELEKMFRRARDYRRCLNAGD